MRIIPKKTKVEMEFFKGIGIVDMVVGLVGASFAVLVFSSDLPFKLQIMSAITLLFAALLFPMDDEKSYMFFLNVLKYLARPRVYVRKKTGKETTAEQPGKEKLVKEQPDKGKKGKVSTAEQSSTEQPGKRNPAGKRKNSSSKQSTKGLTLEDITPFTGVSGGFIEYGKSYYAKVIQISPVEFRFYTEIKQNGMIDHMLGQIIRMVSGEQTASLVKIDRPVIYDEFIQSEFRKMKELKEAYLNGLVDEVELTGRVEVIYDRIMELEKINFDNKVVIPFHYLVFFDKNKSLLEEMTFNAGQILSASAMPHKVLEEKELVVFLKYSYTKDFDEREVEGLSPDRYMDWILPKEIEFTGRTVKYDGVVTHNLRVIGYPTFVKNAWGYQMFNMPDTKVVMKFKPIERAKSIRNIDRSIDELRGQESSTGKTSKLLEISNHIETLSTLLTMLQGDNETLFDVNIYVTVYDEEQTEAARFRAANPKAPPPPTQVNMKKRIRRQLAEGSFRTTDMFLQQIESYIGSQISANDPMRKRGRSIHSSSIAAAFPFVHCFLQDEGGINLGNSSGVPVFIDFYKRDQERINSNMVVIGKSGSGKSYATKTLLTNLAAENSKIFILDPENEYAQLAKSLDGKMIDVGSATQGRMNPFHIITSLADEGMEETDTNISFSTHLQFLEEFFRQILPGIDADALEYLNNLIVKMYESRGIDSETDLTKLTAADYPIFDDLYDKILFDYQASTGDYSKSNLRTLLNYISKFSTGGRNANLWNGEASISTNENFIVFNFQSLLANKNNTIANAQMLLILKWLDNEIIKNRDYNMKFGADRKIIVVIDEAHVFIDPKYPIALDFMYQLAKRIRKYNGMQIIITQNIKDFVGTEEIARKSTAIINACQYSFIFPLAPNDMHDLCRLYEKSGAINETEQEEIVNNGRGKAFAVTSPNFRTSISIVASPEVQKLFS